MIIGLAIATAIGTAGSAIINKASNEVLNETRNKINSTYYEAEELAQKSNEDYNKAVNSLKRQLRSIEKQRIDAYDNVLSSFLESFKKIKNNTELRSIENYSYLDKMNKLHEHINYGISGKTIRHDTREKVADSMFTAITFTSPVVGLLSQAYRGTILDDKLKIAEGELAQVKVEAEKLKVKTVLIRKHVERCKDVRKIIAVFEALLKNSTGALNELITNNGSDYSLYSKEQRELCMTIVNIAAALSAIIQEPVFTDNGNFNANLTKQINNARMIEGISLNG